MNKIKNIVFTLPSLAAAIIFGRGGGGGCALLQSHRDIKCFKKSFNSPKTALETKSASKNRAEKDYEVVDLRWLPRVFTNNPSYQAYVTEGNLVTLSLRFCSRDSPLRLPI